MASNVTQSRQPPVRRIVTRTLWTLFGAAYGALVSVGAIGLIVDRVSNQLDGNGAQAAGVFGMVILSFGLPIVLASGAVVGAVAAWMSSEPYDGPKRRGSAHLVRSTLVAGVIAVSAFVLLGQAANETMKFCDGLVWLCSPSFAQMLYVSDAPFSEARVSGTAILLTLVASVAIGRWAFRVSSRQLDHAAEIQVSRAGGK